MIHPNLDKERAQPGGLAPDLDRQSPVFLDAQADSRWSTPDQLACAVDLFASIADDPEADLFERLNAVQRVHAYREETTRRDRVARLATGQATPADRSHAAWLELARAVRERCSTPEILIMAGVPMVKTGTSRGADEWHGPCPICREGDDRLCAWSGPNGRLWCRRCGWSGDAIAAASLIVGTGQFRDAVRWLAGHVGLEAPR